MTRAMGSRAAAPAEQPHLDVTAPRPQAADESRQVRRAQASSDTCAPAAGEPPTAAGASPARVPPTAPRRGPASRAPARRRRRRPGRRRRRDHDADSPTPPQPCTATHSPRTARHVDHGAVRRGEAAPEPGGGRRRTSSSGTATRLTSARVERDVLGERAPVGEAGLGLPRADLLVAAEAPRALAARVDERHGDPVAGRASAHLGPTARPSGELVTRHVREDDVRSWPSRRASRCGTYRWSAPARRRAGRRFGVGHVPDHERSRELVVDQRAVPHVVPALIARPWLAG